MAVIKFLRDITGLFNWSTDVAPTSQQDYQNAVKNWQETEKNLVDAVLWQPETAYDAGNQVRTPSLPSECVLVCTTAGTSGANEPDYTSVAIGDTVADGTAEWTVASSLTGAGGTLAGPIVAIDDASDIRLCGGTDYSTGAWLGLYGKDNATTPGLWRLQARDGGNLVQLLGYPDGRLMWNGSNVLTDATVGTYTSNSPGSAVSLTANTAKNITSMSLAKGTWIVIGKAYFSSNTADKIYGIQVGTSANDFTYGNSGSVAVHSAYTGNLAVQATDIIVLGSTTTVYLCGFSNNSATVTAATLQAVRIV